MTHYSFTHHLVPVFKSILAIIFECLLNLINNSFHKKLEDLKVRCPIFLKRIFLNFMCVCVIINVRLNRKKIKYDSSDDENPRLSSARFGRRRLESDYRPTKYEFTK